MRAYMSIKGLKKKKVSKTPVIEKAKVSNTNFTSKFCSRIHCNLLATKEVEEYKQKENSQFTYSSLHKNVDELGANLGGIQRVLSVCLCACQFDMEGRCDLERLDTLQQGRLGGKGSRGKSLVCIPRVLIRGGLKKKMVPTK